MTAPPHSWPRWLPGVVAGAALAALAFWSSRQPQHHVETRAPGADHAGTEGTNATGNPVLRGMVTRGPGVASALPGDWPQFRGPGRDGIGRPAVRLLREWVAGQPRALWEVDVGEGYAGPVVGGGRVYLMDYDRAKQQDALRCLALADGKELWRFAYPVSVKRNHGMSRTVPALASNLVVALGPKCHVVCVDATTGELRWGLDLVREFGTTIPPWYAGQCPLIHEGRVILAPGGPEALLVALDLASGKPLWTTPNSPGWKMTHSSVVSMEVGGRRMFAYCASGGVVGVAADDGSLLWQTPEWKISIAMVPSPVPVGPGRLFLSGGYNAGSLLLEVAPQAGTFTTRSVFRLKPEVFGATQHTPIFYEGHLYGIRPEGELVCLSPDGEVRWVSTGVQFGLGPLLVADGLVFALDDSGRLTMAEAAPAGYRQLGQAQPLKGREAWAPMALADGRLLVRDLNRMVCLAVGPVD